MHLTPPGTLYSLRHPPVPSLFPSIAVHAPSVSDRVPIAATLRPSSSEGELASAPQTTVSCSRLSQVHCPIREICGSAGNDFLPTRPWFASFFLSRLGSSLPSLAERPIQVIDVSARVGRAQRGAIASRGVINHDDVSRLGGSFLWHRRHKSLQELIGFQGRVICKSFQISGIDNFRIKAGPRSSPRISARFVLTTESLPWL